MRGLPGVLNIGEGERLPPGSVGDIDVAANGVRKVKQETGEEVSRTSFA